jgi:hypothetical protein
MGSLITEYSLWYLPFCVLIAAGYAALLYSTKSPWTKSWNYSLAAIRFILVFLLLLLLLGPLFRHVKTEKENPIVVLAIDDSKSIDYGNTQDQQKKWLQDFRNLQENLSKKDIDLQVVSLSGKNNQLDSLKAEHPVTPLTSLLKTIQSDFENRNLSSVLMLSDGIINQGSDPSWQTYKFPVHTIGVGDTLAKKDIGIRNLLYNKITYKNSSFPIVVEIQHYGFPGANIEVCLMQGDKTLQRNVLTLSGKEGLIRTEFRNTATEAGLLHYSIQVKPLSGEYTTRNNTAHAYIEVLESKEKILLLAPAPHPDIKALRAALEKKENYEVKLHIPGINEFKDERYDVVIFHQLPELAGSARSLIEKFQKEETSILFILGAQTNLSQFNTVNKVLSVQSRGAQKDQVTGSFNENFLRFTMSGEQKALFKDLPPLTIPYGDYQLREGSDVILFQRIGTVISNRPLLSINTLHRQAVLAGEGLWQWRYHEYLQKEQQVTVDHLITQTVQLLSSKNDKRKFRLQTTQQEYPPGESVIFEAEVYNDIYEPIYGNKIDLQLFDEKGKKNTYSFAVGESSNRFDVKGLSEGMYRFTGQTQLNGKTENVSGQFFIKSSQLEAMQTIADHNLLKNLSLKSGGEHVHASAINRLEEAILKSGPKPILHSQEELTEAMDVPWIFFLLISLAAAEWGIRKYKGGY